MTLSAGLISEVFTTGATLLDEALSAFASNAVPATGALDVAACVSPVGDGNPPVATEPSRCLESLEACVPEKGGAGDCLVLSAVVEAGAEVLSGVDVGSEIEDTDWLSVVDCGAAGLRRKMPLSPRDTGGAGPEDRAWLAPNAGPTITMMRFPSTLVVYEWA